MQTRLRSALILIYLRWFEQMANFPKLIYRIVWMANTKFYLPKRWKNSFILIACWPTHSLLNGLHLVERQGKRNLSISISNTSDKIPTAFAFATYGAPLFLDLGEKMHNNTFDLEQSVYLFYTLPADEY